MSQPTPSPDTQARFKLRSKAFFGRTLAEYLQMLALDLDALRGRKILDVASAPGRVGVKPLFIEPGSP